jgi:hypothetical protein
MQLLPLAAPHLKADLKGHCIPRVRDKTKARPVLSFGWSPQEVTSGLELCECSWRKNSMELAGGQLGRARTALGT